MQTLASNLSSVLNSDYTVLQSALITVQACSLLL